MKHTPHPTATFQHFGLLVMMMTPLVMVACSGGTGGISGSPSVRALSLPDRIESTRMESRTTAGRVLPAAGLFRAVGKNASGDDGSVAKAARVDGVDALEMVNHILRVVKDTGYADFVNQGAYLAMVLQVGNIRQIRSGSSAASLDAEQLMRFCVEVTRDSNRSPMIVKVWMDSKEGPGGGPMRIRGYFSVTRGVSAACPYGVMFAHFSGSVLDGTGSKGAGRFTMAMSVGIDGGDLIVENAVDIKAGDDFGSRIRVPMVANMDRTEGHAYVHDGLN